VIPERWTGFQATRRFRGVTYRVVVSRRGPGNNAALTVDGQAVDGNLVPLPIDGRADVQVKVAIG